MEAEAALQASRDPRSSKAWQEDWQGIASHIGPLIARSWQHCCPRYAAYLVRPYGAVKLHAEAAVDLQRRAAVKCLQGSSSCSQHVASGQGAGKSSSSSSTQVMGTQLHCSSTGARRVGCAWRASATFARTKVHRQAQMPCMGDVVPLVGGASALRSLPRQRVHLQVCSRELRICGPLHRPGCCSGHLARRPGT